MTIDDLRAALAHPNVAAFLRVIRHGESSQADDAYTIINGGAHFTAPPWAHPWSGIPTTQGARACGAFQFLGTTWARVAAQYGLADFSPANQDIGAVALIAGRHALEDVIAGEIPAAIAKCRPEWTSLPGAAENSGRYTLDIALAVYGQYGGQIATQPAAPIEERTIKEPAVPDTPSPDLGTAIGTAAGAAASVLIPGIGPVIGAALTSLIPQLAKLVLPAPTTEVATRNQAALKLAMDTVTQVTGAVNEQDALQKLALSKQGDGALLKQVTQAVLTTPGIAELVEVGGGGIAGAREADAKATQAEHPFWYSPAFWVSMVVLSLACFVVVMPWVSSWATDENRGRVIDFVVNITIAVIAYWVGSTVGSQKKDQTIADLSKTP